MFRLEGRKALRCSLGLVGVCFASLSSYASAEEIVWKHIRVVGGGDGTPCFYENGNPASNVSIVKNGNVISFLFDTVGIFLFPSNQALAHTMSCNIEAKVVIPARYYVETFSQSLAVGVIKDQGTAGGISSNAFLFQDKIPLNQLNMPFFPNQVLNEPLIEKQNTQVFTSEQKKIMCLATLMGPMTTVFKFQVLAAGTRPSAGQTFFTKIDGSDLALNIAPSLKPCGR